MKKTVKLSASISHIMAYIMVCAMAPMFAGSAMADDYDYVLMLEMEAAQTQIDRSSGLQVEKVDINANRSVVRKSTVQCNYNDKTLPANLFPDELALYLETCTHATFVFYSQLSNGSKEMVYKNYRQSTPVKLNTIRKDILAYL